MPIRAYLKPGTVFPPEAVSTMSQAFDGAVSALKISMNDRARRTSVAKTIIRLADEHPDLDATELLRRTIVMHGRRSSSERQSA
jgi:hypothetical protein